METVSLASLPSDLLTQIVRRLAVVDVAAVDCAAGCFHCPAPGQASSAVEQALLARNPTVRAAYAAAPPSSWTQFLLWYEWFDRYCVHQPISAGATHNAFVRADGRLLTCGVEVGDDVIMGRERRSPGALGQGNNVVIMPGPTLVPGCTVRFVSVSVGEGHTLALAESGEVFSCGSDLHGQLGHGSLDEGAAHALYEARCSNELKARIAEAHLSYEERLEMLAGELADATLARFLCSWLSPLQGRHGMGAFAPGETAPHQAVYTPRRIEALADVRATAVAAGGTSSLILLLNGEVHSCGGVLLHGWQRRQGAPWLGHGATCERQALPKRIEALVAAGVRGRGVSAGQKHSLVIGADGDLWSFGYPDARLGRGFIEEDVYEDGIPSPQRYEELSGVGLVQGLSGQQVASACSAGQDHSLVLCADGTCWSFGVTCPMGADGSLLWGVGRLGLGATPNDDPGLSYGFAPRDFAIARRIGGSLDGRRVISISAGGPEGHGLGQSLVATADGSVYTFGTAAAPGQDPPPSQPTQFDSLTAHSIHVVAAGRGLWLPSAPGTGSCGAHALAVDGDGHVFAWGMALGWVAAAADAQPVSVAQMDDHHRDVHEEADEPAHLQAFLEQERARLEAWEELDADGRRQQGITAASIENLGVHLRATEQRLEHLRTNPRPPPNPSAHVDWGHIIAEPQEHPTLQLRVSSTVRGTHL